MRRLLALLLVVILGAVASAARDPNSVEDDAEAGWGITEGSTTYLDFTFSADGYTYSRNGLTLTRDAIDDWGDPDTSDAGDFVDDYAMDDKPFNSSASDFSISITGLAPNTEYGIALSVRGFVNHPEYADFEWGNESDGEPANIVTGVSGQPAAVLLSGGGVDLYAVPICRATSDASGTIVMWFGKGSWTVGDDTRTQLDGVFVGTEILPRKAWVPDPADEAMNVSLFTDLRWDAPADANEFWTYNVYVDTVESMSNPDMYIAGGTDPNVSNSDLGTLEYGDYWWRVDAIDPNGPTTYTGDVWTFTAGVPLPTLVYPPDANEPWIRYELNIGLQWDSHDESVDNGIIQKHQVKLMNITDGTESYSYLKDAVPAPGTDYENYYLGNPDTWDVLFYGKEYKWQVIELGAGDVVLAEGPEWSFNTWELICPGALGAADLAGDDCTITLDDLLVVAQSWLECGWQLPPNGDPIQYPDKDPCNW